MRFESGSHFIEEMLVKRRAGHHLTAVHRQERASRTHGG
jgi:hypothetical protein